MNILILARHAHAASNVGDVVNAVPPGEGLSPQGVEEARALGRSVAAEPIGVGVSSRLLRAQETLGVVLADRDVPTLVEPLLDEIGFGAFEGGSLTAYRGWAWENGPEDLCPGGGESRVQVALRLADALTALLALPHDTVLAVSHGLPVRYVVDAVDGSFPARRIEPVPHAVPYRFGQKQIELAAETLRRWAEAPRFSDLTAATPSGG